MSRSRSKSRTGQEWTGNRSRSQAKSRDKDRDKSSRMSRSSNDTPVNERLNPADYAKRYPKRRRSRHDLYGRDDSSSSRAISTLNDKPIDPFAATPEPKYDSPERSQDEMQQQRSPQRHRSADADPLAYHHQHRFMAVDRFDSQRYGEPDPQPPPPQRKYSNQEEYHQNSRHEERRDPNDRLKDIYLGDDFPYGDVEPGHGRKDEYDPYQEPDNVESDFVQLW